MDNNKLWEFPVPSTQMAQGTRMTYADGDIRLAFSYYDDKGIIYNSGLIFHKVVAHKHTTEKLLASWIGAYDCIIEIPNSNWVKHFKETNEWFVNLLQLKHYAIFLDSNGLFEFFAESFSVLETKGGKYEF